MKWVFLRLLLFALVMFVLSLITACSAESPLESTGEAPDTALCAALPVDTIFFHDTVVVYRDTVEKVVEIVDSVTSIVYRDSLGRLDTLSRNSSIMKCDFDEKSFSCKNDFVPMVKPKPDSYQLVYIGSIDPLDSNKYYVTIMDTVYATLYKKTYKARTDTIFVNYGEHRRTDYIPPEFVYEPGRNPFDSTAMRNFFDTLDVRDTLLGGKGSIKVNSRLSFSGFPLADVRKMKYFVQIAQKFSEWTLPAKRPAEECVYLFNNASQLNSDTTVTWTLGFTHYENGMEEKDSIQVTTFFKVK